MSRVFNKQMTVISPGDLVFNSNSKYLSTLLGSCVSVAIWHPKLCIGGMCHYLLPTRQTRLGGTQDGRYADEAMQLFATHAKELGTKPKDYTVRVYGGANMFPNLVETCIDAGHTEKSACASCPRSSVSCRNCHAAYREARKHGFAVHEADLGGTAHRTIILNNENGSIQVKTMPRLSIHYEPRQSL